jgi:hypothetical protein
MTSSFLSPRPPAATSLDRSTWRLSGPSVRRWGSSWSALVLLVLALDVSAEPTTSTPPALIVEGDQTVVLPAGRHVFSRICVHQRGSLRVRGATTIVLVGNETSVIGGRGIGHVEPVAVTLTLVTEDAPEVHVLFDTQDAPITLALNAPRATVGVGITGRAGLSIGGTGAKRMIHNAAWGLPESFPKCGAPSTGRATPDGGTAKPSVPR